jgi:hypothetical protein
MGEFIGLVLGLILYLIVIGILLALPVMLLWNFVMPDVFGLTEITFWQALALTLLSSFLFKSSTGSSNSK